MSHARTLLTDSFERVREGVDAVLDGLGPQDLAWQPDNGSNPIGWLVWHLTRVQDDHVASVADSAQVWNEEGWVEKFDLPYDADAIGFGQSMDEVTSLDSTAEMLLGYYDAVHERTLEFIGALEPQDFERVVDADWDPPVTLGVRLISVINDDTQHVGQAGYVRGLLERDRGPAERNSAS